MELKKYKSFHLDNLCLNKIDTTPNQSMRKKNKKKKEKTNKNKSNNNSISKILSTLKYNKIDNFINLLKEKDSLRTKKSRTRRKLLNKKILNNLYLSYYTEKSKNNTVFAYPISFSPTAPIFWENKRKSYTINLDNEIMGNSNKYKNSKKKFSMNNVSQDNARNVNIINNTFIPMTETKNNYLNNINTFFHTNFVFKIDSNSNFYNKLYKGSFSKLYHHKKRSINLKNIFDVSNNSIYNNNNQNDNSINYFAHHNIKKHSKSKIYIEEEKENNTELKRKNTSYRITYKLFNNSFLLDSQGIKSDLNTIKDKKNIK